MTIKPDLADVSLAQYIIDNTWFTTDSEWQQEELLQSIAETIMKWRTNE